MAARPLLDDTAIPLLDADEASLVLGEARGAATGRGAGAGDGDPGAPGAAQRVSGSDAPQRPRRGVGRGSCP